MIRTNLLLLLGFVLLLGSVVGIVFGNPFKLEGAKLQEFAGYIIGVLLSTVGILVVSIYAVQRTSSSAFHSFKLPTRESPRLP